ncbi:hypothetical protein FC07_GL000082 [Loigolactobacillus bifermentans DSM 20003]|uniref:Uncharacterized protein n=1 Tax=Loigolactobacillus bifermentans DSM 20003 TaxID=1423726 RepID=A0A0R1GV70_9LACO|nr:hypothetical protein FC07_GL000082 [Loigolactobacillus bifermentans DSM 20003]
MVCGNIDPVFQQFEFFHLKQIKRLKSVRCLSYTEDSKKGQRDSTTLTRTACKAIC